LWEEGAKGPKGERRWKKIESKESNLEMLRPGILENEVKGFSTRNKGTHKNNKTRPS
jgi:hypothetical protein